MANSEQNTFTSSFILSPEHFFIRCALFFALFALPLAP